MYHIQICPIKKLYQIAADAELSEVAVLAVSSYAIDADKLQGCHSQSLHHFDDVTAGHNAFGAAAAEKIKNFVLSLPGELDTLFVCCDSGESRSSAMAAAIMRFYGIDEMKIWKNPRYHPNRLVYKTLCEAFGISVPDDELSGLLAVNEKALSDAINAGR